MATLVGTSALTTTPFLAPLYFIQPNYSKPHSGGLTQDKLQRQFLGQLCWNNVVTIQNNVAAMLKRCDALKIVGMICRV